MIFKQKRYELNDNDIDFLSKQTGLSQVVTKILVSRGYNSLEKINEFLSPNLSQLHDPFLLKNMDIVTEKIKNVIKNKKRILIFGDYDVDGISATAILYKYFQSKGVTPFYYLPNRYEDGYGLTIDTAKKVISSFNPEFLITVDCGISCANEVEFLMQNGIDVVVTDHHEIPQVLPSCPVIDAKMEGQEYPFKDLCGAGVALKIVQALGENLDEYLPICAIATIADIVSLTDENRAIVVCGLKNFNHLPKGLKMLIDGLKITNVSSGDIAFKIAPKINASGRMGDATISLNLYIYQDDKILRDSLEKLTEMNNHRQELCTIIYNDAIELLKKENQNDKRAIILSSTNWDSGLLGIVCARLTEEFNKPTFLFSEVDGLLRGSVRSIAQINIHQVLSSTSTLLETFGGHSMAAGLTLKKENFTKFKYEIENYFLKNFSYKDFINIKEYDLNIDSKIINQKMVRELEVLEPCGCGNPKPIFYTKFSNLKASVMKNYAQHLNLVTPENFSFISFNNGTMQELIENSYVCELTYELQINEFRNKSYVKGLVKNIKCSGYKDSLKDYVCGNYLEQLQLNKSGYKNSFYNYDNLTFLLNKLTAKSSYGTLLVCNDLVSAKNLSMYLFTHQFDFYFKEINSNSSNNAIVVGLDSQKNLSNYSNIVFLEPLLNMDYLNNFKGNLYLPKNHDVNLYDLGLNFSHEYFSNIYKKMLAYHKTLKGKSKYEYYCKLKQIMAEQKGFSYAQFVLCVNTFIELGFIAENKQNGYALEFNRDAQKRELITAKFYDRSKKLLE